MADVSPFDAADAAFREIHAALATSLSSKDVGALIARASERIAECDALAHEKAAAAQDANLPTREALAAKQEGEGLTFVAGRLRGLIPTLDRRLAAEHDAEEQAERREQHGKARARVEEVTARVRKDYPRAVEAILAMVNEIVTADAIAEAANRDLPRDVEHVPNVETMIGAEILGRLHLPSLDGSMAHEMTGDANEAFRTELWNREQQARNKIWAEMDTAPQVLRAVS